MARPRQKDELKRQNKITIRLSDSELSRVTGVAEMLGVTLSSYLRAKALRGYIRVPKYAKIDNEHIGQLSKLGGLLKKMHIENGGLYRMETAAMLDKIQDILKTIQNRLECGEAYQESGEDRHEG